MTDDREPLELAAKAAAAEEAAWRTAVKAEHAVCTWVPVSERMPAPNESQSGYFWCWGPEYDTPELLEVYGYESWELPGTGFCNSAGTATSGNVTHWQPANPPDIPPTR